MPPVDVMSPGPDPRNQQPLDEDFTVLIVPDAIPIPGTSVEVLQTAVAAMRTAAGEVAEGAEGIESTWQGLQPHYTAPESETLFAAMGPVADKGETILDDTTTVADALDTFAEAAQTARTRLRGLKEEAVAFSNEMNNLELFGKDFEYWSMDLRNYLRNRELKLQVNAEWAAFQEAERACANAISAVTGSGNNYVPVSAGEPGAGDIVYGLDPGDVEAVEYDFSDFSDWQRLGRDGWDHLSHSEKPWPLDWAVDAAVAQQENFGVGLLWGLGVGAVSSMGLWREGSGWATSVGEVVDNAVTHKKETFEGYGALVGLYGEDGWMNPFDSGERSGETWRANAGAAWTEVAHDIVPWREWEDRPAYTVSTGAGNAALAVVSLPVRGGSILANLSRGGSDLPNLDPLDRPEVVWEPGAAARPGFSLSQTFNQIRGDFSDTTGGFGARLGDLSGMIERFSAVTPGEGGGSGRGPGVPVSASDPDLPNPRRPVSVPVAGDSSGEPDRPRHRDEDESDNTRDLLDSPSPERWPEMEEMLDAQQRHDGEGRPVAGAGVGLSDASDARTPDADTVNGSDTVEGDGVYTTLDLDAQRIEREHERDTQSIHDEIEEFSALPAERQREWLLANQLVGANGVEAPAGPQNPGFGDRSSDGFGITASHDPDSGNGDGPSRTPRDGASGTGFTAGGEGDARPGGDTAFRPVPEGVGHGRSPLSTRTPDPYSEAFSDDQSHQQDSDFLEEESAGEVNDRRAPAEGIDPDSAEPTTINDSERRHFPIEFGHRDASGRWFDDTGLAHIGTPDYAEHARTYNRIRMAEGDAARIAESYGIQVEVMERIKEHIFMRDHEVAVSADDIRFGRFTPMPHISRWWEPAERGGVPESERVFFRRWLEHEAVESKLMEWGMPYLSSHPSAFAWDEVYEEYTPTPNADHYGAHNLAPAEGKPEPYAHYLEAWEAPEVKPNEDLSNAEEIARIIFERFHGNE